MTGPARDEKGTPLCAHCFGVATSMLLVIGHGYPSAFVGTCDADVTRLLLVFADAGYTTSRRSLDGKPMKSTEDR